MRTSIKKIKVHIDPLGYDEKPSGKEIGGIKTRLQKSASPSLITLEELVQKIEAALKELVFGAYPQYREDKDINIMLTYILYGCYYAFYENRKYGDVPVLSSITELTGKTAQAALKMIKK